MTHVLDGKRLLEWRETMALSLRAAAQLAVIPGTNQHISFTTWSNAENGRRVDRETVLAIAHAMQVNPSMLEVARRAPWQDIPPIEDESARQKLGQAMQSDMQGRHDLAIGGITRVIAELQGEDTRYREDLELLLAIVHDQSGTPEGHAAAQDILTKLRGRPLGTERLPWRIEYHWAINQLRRKQPEGAQQTIETMLATDSPLRAEYEPSLLHQLGNIEVARSRPRAQRKEQHLRAARSLFQRALQAWDRTCEGDQFPGGHRRGFSHRRLASVLHELGELDEARRHWFHAATTLAWFRLTRYLNETVAEYEAHV
ncbi:MAG: hypothetical protein NXI31_08690 [bacterium]|nr:hypothetical protein [bacterium]